MERQFYAKTINNLNKYEKVAKLGNLLGCTLSLGGREREACQARGLQATYCLGPNSCSSEDRSEGLQTFEKGR